MVEGDSGGEPCAWGALEELVMLKSVRGVEGREKADLRESGGVGT